MLLLYAKGLGINREGQAISSAFALHLEHCILDEKIADIKRGQIFDGRNVRAIRPGDGLPTKYLELFMGRRAARDIPRGTPLAWDMLGGNEP